MKQIHKRTPMKWIWWSSMDQSGDGLVFCTGQDQRTGACQIVQTLPCPAMLLLLLLLHMLNLMDSKAWNCEPRWGLEHKSPTLCICDIFPAWHSLSFVLKKPYFLCNNLPLSTVGKCSFFLQLYKFSVKIAQSSEKCCEHVFQHYWCYLEQSRFCSFTTLNTDWANTLTTTLVFTLQRCEKLVTQP